MDCPHAPRSNPICDHLIGVEDATHQIRFRGSRCEVVCDACGEGGAPATAGACDGCWLPFLVEPGGVTGTPAPRQRDGGLAFTHETVRLDTSYAAWAPIARTERSRWIVCTEDRRLLRLDLLSGEIVSEHRPEGLEHLDPALPVELFVSPGGRFAALVERGGGYTRPRERAGTKGIVVDLDRETTTLRLDRGDYHPEVCGWPLAFVERAGTTAVVHATAWNRLDVSDAETGAPLASRESPRIESGRPRPDHYLDYFHCGLLVSPDGAWIADGGWVWQPIGLCRTWSLDAWLGGNPWESEDGASVKEILQDPWDGPKCWLGPRELLLQGCGVDVGANLALVFDVTRGRVTRWFPALEAGLLALDGGRLLSVSASGTSIWDPATGERLAFEKDLRPSLWHPGARHFLTPGARDATISFVTRR